jgi:hypothetical protein
MPSVEAPEFVVPDPPNFTSTPVELVFSNITHLAEALAGIKIVPVLSAVTRAGTDKAVAGFTFIDPALIKDPDLYSES